jgi:hypothetical protein
MEMKGATGERWRTLREQAQTGHDPKKFMALVQESSNCSPKKKQGSAKSGSEKSSAC